MFKSLTQIRLWLFGLLILAAVFFLLDFSGYLNQKGIQLPAFLSAPYRLGLDLQGGTHLVYEADTSQVPELEEASAVEGVRDVIERRVNAFGVSEPVVQTVDSGDNWRIIVELAGISDVNQAIEMIGQTPLLEFKEQATDPNVELSEDQQAELKQFNDNAKEQAQSLLDRIREGESFEDLAGEFSHDPGSFENGGDLGFVPRGTFFPEFEEVCFDQLAIDEVSELVETQVGYHIIKKVDERGEGESKQVQCRHILITTQSEADYLTPSSLYQNTGLSGKQLQRAQVVFNQQTGQPEITLQFNDEGQKLFEEITQRNIGKGLAIFLDGQSPVDTTGDGEISNDDLYAPVVQQVITGGSAVISGDLTLPKAKEIARLLSSGALPVPIELVAQETVGAALGATSLQKSLTAGMIGMLVVSLFMILYYRLPGLISVISLIFYGLAVLAIFKSIPITLTLAGIAGFILSIGMAVDANILIFERIKEEIRKGKLLNVAINEGFVRAWPSIFDGNISTLVTCAILVAFTTSLVKGFALTLGIGILISMFSAMIVSRLLLLLASRFKFLQNTWLYGGKK